MTIRNIGFKSEWFLHRLRRYKKKEYTHITILFRSYLKGGRGGGNEKENNNNCHMYNRPETVESSSNSTPIANQVFVSISINTSIK